MKQLPSNRSVTNSYITRPILTHGVPGIMIGATITVVLVIANVVHAILSMLPIFVGLIILIPSLCVYLHGVLKHDEEVTICAGTSGMIAFVWLVLYFIFSAIGNSLPVRDLDCSKHGNSYTKQILDPNNSTPHVSIICKDGYNL